MSEEKKSNQSGLLTWPAPEVVPIKAEMNATEHRTLLGHMLHLSRMGEAWDRQSLSLFPATSTSSSSQ